MSSKISPKGRGFQQFPITIQAASLETAAQQIARNTWYTGEQRCASQLLLALAWPVIRIGANMKLQECSLATLAGAPVCVP